MYLLFHNSQMKMSCLISNYCQAENIKFYSGTTKLISHYIPKRSRGKNLLPT